MTKAEALNELMYGLKFHDSMDFEADDQSYSIDRVLNDKKEFQGWTIKGLNINELYTNKTDLKKGISKLGKKILCL